MVLFCMIREYNAGITYIVYTHLGMLLLDGCAIKYYAILYYAKLHSSVISK